MKILIACEESQRVCSAFRKKGHECYSCDIIEPSGNHPEWHILGDALIAIKGGTIITMDGKEHYIGKWDMIIAHPPCTYLTVSGNSWFNVEKYGNKALERARARESGVNFFMSFIEADCDKIAVENPVGIMSTRYRKPDQIIQPWQFRGPECKATCLWLKGLPPLIPTNIVEPRMIMQKNGEVTSAWAYETFVTKPEETARTRSRTFIGIATAMSEQWGVIKTNGT